MEKWKNGKSGKVKSEKWNVEKAEKIEKVEKVKKEKVDTLLKTLSGRVVKEKAPLREVGEIT